jgi:hypothetical protein
MGLDAGQWGLNAEDFMDINEVYEAADLRGNFLRVMNVR